MLNRYQSVVLNGVNSSWSTVNAGVTQGSVLGPSLFLVYINDLSENILAEIRLFADDSSLFTRVDGIDSTPEKIENDLVTITN